MSITCCHVSCSAPICFAEGVETRLRRTHEPFMCPFGHSQSFVTETDQERKHRIELADARRARDRWREIAQERDEEFGLCPFGCGWRSRSGIDRRWLQMFKHFSKAHGNMLPRRMVWASRPENQKKAS